jgi:putative nucleotidyltransferase with HDIG domain
MLRADTATIDLAAYDISDAARVIASRVTEITTLPQVAQRVLQIAADPHAGIAELRQAMEADPALGARVMRLANSSAVGSAHRITNLQLALAYLGVRQVRNLAWTTFVCDFFRKPCQIGPYRRSQLWNHSVAVGLLARMIALRVGRKDFEDVFLAGLLHDLGMVLIDQYDHDRFRRMIQGLTAGNLLEVMEKVFLGYTHSELGAAVGAEWHLPPVCLATLRWHHHPQPPVEEYREAIYCVALANYLASVRGITSVGLNLVRPPTEAVEHFALSRPDIEALLLDFGEELIRQAGLFVLD